MWKGRVHGGGHERKKGRISPTWQDGRGARAEEQRQKSRGRGSGGRAGEDEEKLKQMQPSNKKQRTNMPTTQAREKKARRIEGKKQKVQTVTGVMKARGQDPQLNQCTEQRTRDNANRNARAQASQNKTHMSTGLMKLLQGLWSEQPPVHRMASRNHLRWNVDGW